MILAPLLEANADAASTPDNHGMLPLHVAVEKDLNTEAFAVLLAADPDALLEEDSSGRLPLHRLTYRGLSAETVSLISEKCPQAFEEASRMETRLPLHYAAELGHDYLDLVKQVFYAYRPAARCADAKGSTPLHQLISGGISDPNFCKELLDSYPEAVRLQDAEGNLPLHFCGVLNDEGDIKQVMQILLGAHPTGAAATTNSKGLLPLHAALYDNNYPQLEVVSALLDAHPEAAAAQTRDGRTPLDLYIQVSKTKAQPPCSASASASGSCSSKASGSAPVAPSEPSSVVWGALLILLSAAGVAASLLLPLSFPTPVRLQWRAGMVASCHRGQASGGYAEG